MIKRKKCATWVVAICIALAGLAATVCAETKMDRSFYFGKGSLPKGFVRVTPQQEYSTGTGHGWMQNLPQVFAVDLPEGNYSVTVGYESPAAAAASTVKAEARRLMLQQQEKVEGKIRRFSVNLRRPEIVDDGAVRLNEREKYPESGEWDERLTLEFLPGTDGVIGVMIESAPGIKTLYVAGDSTVTNQRNEPWCGWGQMLPCFFGPEVAVANHAESGRALYSFRYEKRLGKILSTIQPGDYLFIQFGHNDQKNKKENAGPFTTYKADLEDFIARAREKKARPVLVTPMERRRWSGGRPGETLTDYAAAVKQVGREQQVTVIDLHAMSLKFYAALGREGSKQAFVHYPANSYPGQGKQLKDDTHHNPYGAYELARCMVEGIRAELPELAADLRPGIGVFDPEHPDDPAQFVIPASLAAGAEKPEGN